jgi:predicted metal-dependent peptidase
MKSAVLMHVPFFAALLLDRMTMKVGKFPNIPTAGTDGKTVWFDEDFLNSLTLKEAMFVCCHEVAHAMWMHMDRAKKYGDLGTVNGKPFDAMKWNTAADYVINYLLVEAGIGKMPAGGLYDGRYTSSMSVEEVYAQLPDPPPSGGGGGSTGDGGDNGDGDGSDGGGGRDAMPGFDVHVPAQSEVSQEEWKRAVASAVQAAKTAGKLPGALERFAEALLNPQVTWQEVLRRRLTALVGRDARTWAKLHRRRLVAQGVVMPGYAGHRAGTVVVVVDTSGSISSQELTVFLTEVQAILDDVQPQETVLVACDTKVQDVHTLYPGDSLTALQLKLGGGGGTSFVPPFEWVAEQSVYPDTLVYLTDMHGTFPADPGYPVIWCATSDREGPFGETIRLEVGGGLL